MSISIRTSVHSFTGNMSSNPEQSWIIVSLAGRVDAFADKRTVAGLKMSAPSPSSWVALDLSKCEFLSIWALKEVAGWAIEQQRANGRLVILSPNESIRRQLDVFIGQGLVIYQDWATLEIDTFYRLQREAAASEARLHP
jgi:anti-anti-sigma regulatory factor